jgi:hypothetical protein
VCCVILEHECNAPKEVECQRSRMQPAGSRVHSGRAFRATPKFTEVFKVSPAGVSENESDRFTAP